MTIDVPPTVFNTLSHSIHITRNLTMKSTLLVLLGTIFASFVFAAPAARDSAFVESDIVLHTTTGDIVGTLAVPDKSTGIPVALIIAGSGPTDRNGNNPMMKNNSLKDLAYALANQGIATLRYDKRAIAESKAAAKKEEDLRFEDYVNDAKGWVDLLKADKRFSQVVVIGHSEGSLIGMIAARTAGKYISIAGAGQSADKIIKIQLAGQPKAIQDLCYPIIDSLKSGRTVDSVSFMLQSLFRPSVQPYLISWFRYDPQEEIGKLTIPVLILQGTQDIQVSVDDANRLARAQPKAKLVILDGMNHIFRTVVGDKDANIATYTNASLPLAEGLVKSICEFIGGK